MSTMSNVEQEYRNRRPQGHWFDADTMRFFKSRIGQEISIPSGWLFVTSERQDWQAPRRYSIRYLNYRKGADIYTVGPFYEFTASEAKSRIRAWAKLANRRKALP